MAAMLRSWVQDVAPDRVFVSAPQGDLTYGELAKASEPALSGQIIVRPGSSLETVVDLMTLPGRGRQVVLLDPALPEDEGHRRMAAAREAAGREALTVVFTSGSTGPAKAVRLTASNWQAAAVCSAAHLGHEPGDVWLAAMPLHHVGGLSILYRSAWVGAGVRWLPDFAAPEFAAELASGVTFASVVPTMLRRVLDCDDRQYSGLRAVLVGGGPIPPGLLEEAAARGIPAVPTYGLTETCAQVATLRPGSPVEYAVEPLPGVEMRIGTGSRIEVRAPQVAPGYADTDDRAPDSWFRTPDLGELDPDGKLRVLGRADDVIVTGGENVNPARVETVLCSHPGVWSVVVVGLDDPEWGQTVAALYEGPASPDEVLGWARDRLGRPEVPKTVRRVEAIPVGPSGKPDRAAARVVMNR